MARDLKILFADSVCAPTAGCRGCELCNTERRSCCAAAEHDAYADKRAGYSPVFDQIIFRPGDTAVAAKMADLMHRRHNKKPWLDGRPRIIAIGSRGDVLCDGITFEYLRREIVDGVSCPHGCRHVWLLPTKRPERLREFATWLAQRGITWPRNLAVGVSVTTTATLGRIDHLLEFGDEQTRRFVLVEPQLERLDLSRWLSRLGWVIQGGEVGPQARPFDVAWARELRDHCCRARVPFFLGQLGANVVRGNTPIRLGDRCGADSSEWPADVPRVRQVPDWDAPDANARQRTSVSQIVVPKFSAGNRQLGKCLSFDLTPIETCPGCKHSICPALCWAQHNCYAFPEVKAQLAANTALARNCDLFKLWIIAKLRRRNAVAAVRLPGTGDIFSPDFARAIGEVVRALPGLKFWCYSRTWPFPEIWNEVVKLNSEPNCTVFASMDRKMIEHFGEPADTGLPLCWLAENDEDVPTLPVDVVWRNRGKNNRVLPPMITMNGCLVCPAENGILRITCEECKICWGGSEFRAARIEELRWRAERERRSVVSLATLG